MLKDGEKLYGRLFVKSCDFVNLPKGGVRIGKIRQMAISQNPQPGRQTD